MSATTIDNINPNAILELWPPPEAKLSETIRKEDVWVDESVAYLRQFIHG